MQSSCRGKPVGHTWKQQPWLEQIMSFHPAAPRFSHSSRILASTQLRECWKDCCHERHNGSVHWSQRLLAPRPLHAAASGSTAQPEPEDLELSLVDKLKPHAKIMAGVGLALLFGVTNRVLYKMALVPMQNYVFFLAQFQNLGYLTVYFTTLYVRLKAGKVTPEMLNIDMRPLWAIGACEAVAQLLFMVSAAHLPGPMLPVINQSYLVWNLLFAAIFLGTQFSKSQLTGAAMITFGVILAGAPPTFWSMILGSGSTFGGTTMAVIEPMYVALGVTCFAFPALASILKDMIFKREKERLGQPLDIFIVNSFGSLFQAIFVLLFLPISSALYGVSLPDLPAYLVEGAQCLRGLTPACGADCSGAPLLPAAYVAANLAFNISMLTLLRSVGAVTTTIAGSCLVPLTILAFTLPLPLLPPSVMTPAFVGGAGLLCLGLVVYNYNVIVRPIIKALTTDSVDLPAS